LRIAAFAVSVGVIWLDPTGFEPYVWFSFVAGFMATGSVYLIGAGTKAFTSLRPVKP
jgi:hypothetical protein